MKQDTEGNQKIKIIGHQCICIKDILNSVLKAK